MLTGRATMNPRASHSAFFAAGCHPACGFVRCAHMSAREEEWLEEFTAERVWAPGLRWLHRDLDQSVGFSEATVAADEAPLAANAVPLTASAAGT